tara:strand:- start:35 stop:796 length:762 start_codon:yes stop_codon:yes gene_type:complete
MKEQKMPIVLESFNYKKNLGPFKAVEIFQMYLIEYDALEFIDAETIAQDFVLGGIQISSEKFIIKIEGEYQDIYYLFKIQNRTFSLGEILECRPVIFENNQYIDMYSNENMHSHINSFFENKQETIELSENVKRPLVSPTVNLIKRSDSLLQLRNLVEKEIESIYGDEFFYCPESGAWQIESYLFTIFATPFWDDHQGIIIDIVEHNSDENIFKGSAKFSLTENNYLNALNYLSVIKESYNIARKLINKKESN